MQASASRPHVPTPHPADLAGAAFRELHGSRLHAFALLLTLGDRALAARLAADALAAGAARATELRHPERAAAWLRRRVAEGAPRRPRGAASRSTAKRRPGLDELGVDPAVFEGLAALDRRGRAALVADVVERLDRGDVGTIVGLDGSRLDRCIRVARSRFLAAAVPASHDEPNDDGPIVMRIRAVASRALA